MMENHSFDNLLGALSRSGQPQGRRANVQPRRRGAATATPARSGPVLSFPFPTTAQGPHVSQTWNATHEQIDGGKMDGFVRSVELRRADGLLDRGRAAVRLLVRAHVHARQPLVLLGPLPDLPQPPLPDGRHRLRRHRHEQRKPGGPAAAERHDLRPPDAYGISWHNYFTDLPQTGIIPTIIEKYPSNLVPIAEFFADCAAGSLPSVSFVDPEFGVLSDIGGPLSALPGIEADHRQARHHRRRRGEPAGHVLRRVLGLPGRRRGAALARLAAHAA